jgi:hypothetical protein
VEYRNNTNTSNIIKKSGHAKGRPYTREGQYKKEVKKVNIVDVLPIQE